MNASKAAWGVALLVLHVTSAPTKAAQQCNTMGLCQYFVPPEKLPPIQAQQTSVWCWAASAQTIFRYYGHDVPQAAIVEKAFGAAVPNTGPPDIVIKMLNSEYIDSSGRHFIVRTPQYVDQYQLMPGNYLAFGMQPGFSNSEILEELAADRPVFYADGPHAMVLVGASAISGNPISGWVMDPAPRIAFGVGPLIDPNIPAVGVRQLLPNEMHAFFAAKVVLE